MRDAAVAVVLDDQRQSFLLVQRSDVPVWVLPGGGIDRGETPEEAVRREVLEESGFEVRIVRPVAIYTPTGRLSSRTYLFECAVVSGAARVSSETSKVSFFPIESYPPPVFEVHRGWLHDALANCPDVLVKPVGGLDGMSVLRMLVRHPILVMRYFVTRLGLRRHAS